MGTIGSLNGTNMLLYIGGTAIAGSKTCEYQLTHSPRETTTKDDGGVESFAEGKRGWNAKTDGLVILPGSGTTFSALFAAWKNRTKVSIKFSTEVSGDKYYTGLGYIKDLSQNAPDNASATYSVSFDGTGDMTETAHT